MWPFDKVLWWCCRPKGIPRDRHGEAPRVSHSVVCRSLRQAFQSRPSGPGWPRLNQVGHTEKYKYEIRAYEIGLNLFQVSVYTSQIHVNVKHWPPPESAWRRGQGACDGAGTTGLDYVPSGDFIGTGPDSARQRGRRFVGSAGDRCVWRCSTHED